jgi:multidrug efflux system outer membrane protein
MNKSGYLWILIFTSIIAVGCKTAKLPANALQRIKVAQSNVLLSKGAMKPFLRGAAAANVTKYGDYTMDGAGNIGTRIYDGRFIPQDLQDYLVGLQASWEVDVWGKLRNKKKAAMNRFLASVEGRNLVTTGFVAEVATAYYELLSLDNQLDIVNETIKLQKDALEIVKVQKQAAMANELAVEQFEAQLLEFESMRQAALQDIVETESRLNLLLGRYPQTISRDKVLLSKSLPVQVRTGIPYALLQNRPDIRQAELELAATRADVKAAKAAFYPSLNITGNVGFEAFMPTVLFNTPQSLIYSILGGLTAPLLNRSLFKAELNRANAGQQEALYSYQKVVATGYTEVHVQMSKISILQKIYDLKVQQSSTLARSVETSSVLFKMGRSSYLEVLIAQQSALKSRLDLINARKEQFNSTVHIYRAIGGGWR